jgi:hypothetical protein
MFSISLLSGCANQPYHPVSVAASTFIQRSLSQEKGNVRVTVSVPDANETLSLTGLDLYDQGIQPVWLNIANKSTVSVRMAQWSIDHDYFSPLEVAYVNRRSFSRQGQADMERWFYENRLERRITPGESRSGLVYTHYLEGTKGFNVDIFSQGEAHYFTFFVPIPGFTPDYMETDFRGRYAESQLRELNVEGLQTFLGQELACCATDVSGQKTGAPFNLVLVGTPQAVRRALLRGGWNETAHGSPKTETARKQHYRGKSPDGTFTLDRSDGNETLEIRLWASHLRVAKEPVWIGQAIYSSPQNASLESKFLQRFARESISADIDSAMQFVYQSFYYGQSLSAAGLVAGVAAATVDDPILDFTGAEYFTLGGRIVIYLSERPVALDEGKVIYGMEPSSFRAFK